MFYFFFFSFFFDQLEVEFMEFSDEGYILHIRRIEAYGLETDFAILRIIPETYAGETSAQFE